MASNYSRQTSAHSAGDTITDAHLDDEFDYLYATVLNGGASTGIGTNDLMNDAVDGTKLADDACDSEHYTDGSIDTAHLSADCVDATKLADDAVVDANIDTSGAFSIFGTKVTTDSLTATLVKTEIYKVGSDGFVEVNYTNAGIDTNILGYIDTASDPATVVHRATTSSLGNPKNVSFTMVVPKDNYWKITSSGSVAPTIYWTPIGTGTCVKQ
jgi:hypothetical protein